MKKIVNLLLYFLLGIVVSVGVIQMRRFIVQDEERRIETEAQMQRQAALAQAQQEERRQEEERKREESRRVVLVHSLALYPKKNIQNPKAGRDTVFSYGDTVMLLEEDGLYAKVLTQAGETGYVWRDCIASASDQLNQTVSADTPPKVILIDVQKDGKDTDRICFSVAENVEKRLEALGYAAVLACRETQEAPSDAKRAQLASQIRADAVVRICIGGKDTDAETQAADEEQVTDEGQETDEGQAMDEGQAADAAQGAQAVGVAVYYSAKDNPHTEPEYYADSKKLGKSILNKYQAVTGFADGEAVESREQEVLNLSKRPMAVLCMGSMHMEQQAAKMAKPKFQAKMAKGIADGVDAYLRKSK